VVAMSETVTIPKEEYELLVKCRRLVESEFEKDFTEDFIQAVRRSEKAYKEGQFKVCKTKEEREKLFDSL
jgi:hypothetical protein